MEIFSQEVNETVVIDGVSITVVGIADDEVILEINGPESTEAQAEEVSEMVGRVARRLSRSHPR